MTAVEADGTVSREQRYVRADCGCGEADTLVYGCDCGGVEALVCSWCMRSHVKEHKHEETCDVCGGGPAWRDPLAKEDAFKCAGCHVEAGSMVQNKWSVKAREGRVLGIHDKAKCSLAGITPCKGEVKPRGGAFKQALVCNKHAGKASAGPDWHQ